MHSRVRFGGAFSISALSFVCALALPAAMAVGQATYTNWESPQTHSVELTPSGAVLLVVNTPDAKLEVFDVVKGVLQKRGSVSVGLDPVSVRARTETEAYPNRNMDSSLKTSIAFATGTGSAVSGLNIFTNVNTFGGAGAPGGAFKCATCHAGTSGSNHLVDIPGGANPTEQQNRKNAPLRDVYRNVGANRASLTANRGFGFDHDGEESTLQEVLAEGFTFSTGATGVQQKKDVEAYLLSFGTDTHGGVGAQTTASNAGGTGDDSARISQMITLATSNDVGLIVKGRVAGIARGWTFVSGTFKSDRSAETIAPAALLALAASGSELTYTLVGSGSQIRLGIDRDLDGAFDRDEIDAGTDPADASSHPTVCIADISGGDHVVDGSDLSSLLSNWGAIGGIADINHDQVVDGADMAIMLSSWGPCP